MKMKCYIDSQARCSLENAVCFIPTVNYNFKSALDILTDNSLRTKCKHASIPRMTLTFVH